MVAPDCIKAVAQTQYRRNENGPVLDIRTALAGMAQNFRDSGGRGL